MPNPPTLTGPGDWAVYYGNTGITLSAQHNGDPNGDAVTHYYFEIFKALRTPTAAGSRATVGRRKAWGSTTINGGSKSATVEGPRAVGVLWYGALACSTMIQSTSFNWQWCRDAWGGPERICFCAQTNARTLRLQVNSATDGSGNGEWQVLNELGTPNYSCATDNDRPPNWTQLEYETGCHLVRL